ncbi:hypothetical protein T492DRAFT_832241 [Pavlovales sp. CCMP2436]|nr:hypothetical protein T492DRAFT_832241 [Pavlovales sp. CCMP2436]
MLALPWITPLGLRASALTFQSAALVKCTSVRKHAGIGHARRKGAGLSTGWPMPRVPKTRRLVAVPPVETRRPLWAEGANPAAPQVLVPSPLGRVGLPVGQHVESGDKHRRLADVTILAGERVALAAVVDHDVTG